MLFKFQDYICDGDTSTIEYNGFTVTARIVHDEITTPTDYEGIPPEMVEAWKKDEWDYSGVVLSVEYNGVLLDAHAASLWGIERNYPGGDNSYFAEVAEELLPDAVSRASEALEELRKAVLK